MYSKYSPEKLLLRIVLIVPSTSRTGQCDYRLSFILHFETRVDVVIVFSYLYVYSFL